MSLDNSIQLKSTLQSVITIYNALLPTEILRIPKRSETGRFEKLQELDNAGRCEFRGGMKRSRCTYFDQCRSVSLDQTRRRISLEIMLVSQGQTYGVEEYRTHVGSMTCLQPSLWLKRLSIISKDLSILIHDP